MAGHKHVPDEKIIENKELNIWEALIPILILIAMLSFNIFYADGAFFGDYSNQIILLIGAAIALVVGLFNKVSIQQMILEIWDNLKKTTVPIIILLLVGALAGTWLVSGIIPTMIYYGLQILSPSIFLPACIIISSVISLATGSSWTTSATVGIALIGIGQAIGMPAGMVAGAVISGAYFGDKMSPLSDTTNLAPAMAGTDLFTHIRYMTITTVPSIIIALIVFIVFSFTVETKGATDISQLLTALEKDFNITPFLFVVPLVVILLILRKTKPVYALSMGILLALVAAFIYQGDILTAISETGSQFMGAINSIFFETQIESNNETLKELFNSGGMVGMLWTIILVVCAMAFGGVMEAIGALSRISSALLSLSDSIFGLFASTVASCLALNVTASDQYLAIVVPGKMFTKAYEDKGLAPENLSRTLEDSGTVTSVLVPWNSCGAYQSSVLGVSVFDYFLYAIFNWISPFMTLLVAGLGIKIRQMNGKV